MTRTVTNPEIIAVVEKNRIERDSIMARQIELNDVMEKEIFPRIDALNIENNKFKELMDAEYGWGGWTNFNAKDLTFTSRDEYDDKYYIIANPAVREKVQLPDDVIEETIIVPPLDDLGVVGEQIKEANEDILMNEGTLNEPPVVS